jgi:hypothetical protein
MTAVDKLSKDQLKFFDSTNHNPYFEKVTEGKKVTSSERVILECVWTDKLQSELDYANSFIFRNFQLIGNGVVRDVS